MSGSFLSQPDKRAKKLYIFIIIFLGAYVNRQGKYGGEIFGGFMGNVYKSAKRINRWVVDCDINQRCIMGCCIFNSDCKVIGLGFKNSLTKRL